MDGNQPASTSYSAPASPNKGMFGTNIPSSVAFAIAILLFLLPFSEIKCGGSALMNKSGLNFAMGKEWKFAGGMGQDMMKEMNTKTGGKKEGKTQIFIIAAMILGVVGLGVSFADAKTAGRVGLVSGVLGAGLLVAFMFDLKKWFNEGLAKEAADKAKEGTDSMGLGNMANMTMAFTPWFYVAIIAFLAAAFFSFKRSSST